MINWFLSVSALSTAPTTIYNNGNQLGKCSWPALGKQNMQTIEVYFRKLTKMIRRRQLEHPSRSVLSLFLLLCSVCLFVFVGNFFVVTAQLRREKTKGLLYLTTRTARRKKFTFSYWLGRGALSSATNWFPFCQVTGRPRIIVKKWKECKVYFKQRLHRRGRVGSILGDPGADSGSEGKSKRAGK